MKGYKYTATDPYYAATAHVKQPLHYIDVPVLARINAGGLFFEAGPQFGYLVAAKYSLDGDGNVPIRSYSGRDGLRKVDFGYAMGLGYQLPNGPVSACATVIASKTLCLLTKTQALVTVPSSCTCTIR